MPAINKYFCDFQTKIEKKGYVLIARRKERKLFWESERKLFNKIGPHIFLEKNDVYFCRAPTLNPFPILIFSLDPDVPQYRKKWNNWERERETLKFFP